MKLYLASKSPRRKELLENLGYKFTIESLDTDETMDKNLDVYQNVMEVSFKKAEAVSKLHPNDVVLGCDTVVVYNNRIYGKPHSKEDAFETLKELNNETHSVISGVNIITPTKTYKFYVESHVTFKNNGDDDLMKYIETGEPMDKAGSYAIQGIGSSLIESYTGELNNIIGLPTKEVDEILKEVFR